MRKIFVTILCLACAANSSAQNGSASHFDGNSWWAHVKFLADDSLEGRDTGSEGLRKAQAYAVEQLQKAGLEPAGGDGFYQPVRFNQYEVDEAKSSLALVANGQAKTLSFADDAFISSRASHYQTAGERWKSSHAAGAIGTMNIANPASMDIPWSRISVNRNHPSMDLADAEFNETPGQQLGVAFNPASAEQLFAGSGHTFAEIAALGKDRKPLPHFALAAALKADAVILTKTLESSNIVAKLTGSDPALKNEFVVLSAHIDHIGIGAPI